MNYERPVCTESELFERPELVAAIPDFSRTVCYPVGALIRNTTSEDSDRAYYIKTKKPSDIGNIWSCIAKIFSQGNWAIPGNPARTYELLWQGETPALTGVRTYEKPIIANLQFFRHYIRVNKRSEIIHGFSDAFEKPRKGDVCVNERGGLQFSLLGTENPALINSVGVYLFLHTKNNIRKRTDEEQNRGGKP
jgi:hypothetical protein